MDITLELTREEARMLLDMFHLAEKVAYCEDPETGVPRLIDHMGLVRKLYKLFHANGLDDCIKKGVHGLHVPTDEFDEQTPAREQLRTYNALVFWKQLRHRLAVRDANERVPYVEMRGRYEHEEWDRMVTHFEYRYFGEFTENGVAHVRVVRGFP